METQQTIRGPYGGYKHNGIIASSLCFLLVSHLCLAVFSYIRGALMNIEGYGIKQVSPMLLIALIITLPMISLFILWLYRACQNGWLLNAPKMVSTPLDTLTQCIVPPLFCWKPLVSLEQIRKATYEQKSELQKLLPIWWISVIITHGTLMLSFLFHQRPDHTDSQLIASNLFEIVILTSIPLDLLTIIVIYKLTKMQKHRMRQLQPN